MAVDFDFILKVVIVTLLMIAILYTFVEDADNTSIKYAVLAIAFTLIREFVV